jgi:hypothetical protein
MLLEFSESSSSTSSCLPFLVTLRMWRCYLLQDSPDFSTSLEMLKAIHTCPDSLATFHNCKVSHCRFAPNIDKGVTLCFDSTVKQIVITSRPQVCSRVDMFLANSFEFYVISEGPRCVQDVMAGSIANHQQVFCCRDDEP